MKHEIFLLGFDPLQQYENVNNVEVNLMSYWIRNSEIA